ncbi:NADH-quinone oxidoreductase subunit L [Malaciobacter pacificus]|uniref:NADH:quinone oxidoreductase I, membrane subunit L n=1 Tax=Malaciobacter pacificus TaxID=1080223 RepID=A0A5C2HFB3_9BACT|nr:NADH-quinone oxidoreductase subunit L [Malaciobacter pacificus]QEP35524.1 NADH:quinone oxidoreductase I, membrane subunit L [Malaciobacter pacificus]GGD41549.1 NADH-quinone oxidoreductase subunit L [Malaciobacter pacificus]
MEKYIYIALFAPLVGSLVAALFSTQPKTLFTGIFTSFMLAVSMVASLNLLHFVYTTETTLHVNLFDWIVIGSLDIPFGFVVDHVSVVMMSVVTVVSTMVHIHSIGYMEHDKGFNRYFSYLSAFVFSMLVLVMGDNFAVLFIGWEGVGVCSWLLIGFWYHKESASWAANEAFIMNRVGDLGLLLGMFLIYWNLGSLQYDVVFAQISTLETSTLVWIGALLFLGAMGKSAQFPLHTWLADAMEGPTPVSALIHAATMVTAGVYLVVRANELYTLIPEVGYAIAALGAFVAIFAATMALVNNDMKRIIAYSTLSQLGYMFVAAGLGAYWVALFHLAAHAFFKSVLFLGAGNVMHAMDDELDIRKMGGLHKKMKATSYIMIIASLALAGIFPLAGFFSKDKILEAAFNADAIGLWVILWITAGLTAFYSFRLVMKIFFGKQNYSDEEFHPHEAKGFVIAAMIPLAVLAVIAGWFEHAFVDFVTKTLPTWEANNLEHSTVWILILITSAVAIGGIAVAVIKYRNDGFSKSWEDTFIYKLLSNQYYIPKFYEVFISKPYYAVSVWVWKVIEIKLIDNSIDNLAHFINKLGVKARPIQSGNLSTSLRLMVVGLILGLVLALVLSVL